MDINTNNIYRDVTINQLSEANVGETKKIAGWIENIRDHGGVSFIDLRDMYGVMQVVMRDTSLLEGLSKEDCISVEGPIEHRDEETYNPKIPTGTIELEAKEVKVLGKTYRQLPFEVMTSKETREDVRLKYRYLDLRNPELHKNIVFRSQIISYLRRQMEEMGFLDLQTPILTSSSPEGARDYLVPSRKHPGEFYALPQSPQQFKQLLMVAGFDKYYQIAPCFRDEDARGDRSPGEFYQLDFEMAFAEQEDIFAVGEKVLYNTFKKFSNKEVSPAPFRRITFKDAMLHYGSDKPDLRNPLLIEDLTDFFADVEFGAFKGKPVRGIVAHCADQSKKFFEDSLKYALSIGMKGLGYLTLKDGGFKGPIDKFLTTEQRSHLIDMLGMKDGDVVFFISDGKTVVDGLAGGIRKWLGERLNLIDNNKFEFCYIVDFPMYELNPDTHKIDFTHNPFSMPQGGLEALENKDPLEINAYQYDIVCNGIELSSGAVRNHNPEIMRKAFAIAGYGEEEVARKFGALYTAFQYGAPPHAGMAPGIDRMVMLLADEDTIRDVIAFPLNGAAQDLMMNAPSRVTEQQLEDVHIRVREV